MGAERVMSGGRNNEEEAMARESISGSQFLLTLTLGGLLLTGCAKEVTVIESQVPPTVLRAFRAQYPGSIAKNFAKETKWFRVLYEVETDGQGAPRIVTYTPAGKLVETEQQIPVAELPVAVQDAVKKASPMGTVKLVELSKKGGGVVYEVEISEGGRGVEYKFDPSGRLLKTEKK
jgi:uncharacterized membrane protein YkoI